MAVKELRVHEHFNLNQILCYDVSLNRLDKTILTDGHNVIFDEYLERLYMNSASQNIHVVYVALQNTCTNVNKCLCPSVMQSTRRFEIYSDLQKFLNKMKIFLIIF